MLNEVLKHIPVEVLALHCHDTYGQALANILRGLDVILLDLVLVLIPLKLR
jgi:hydroxymethylglutaryl-CoA lyase